VNADARQLYRGFEIGTGTPRGTRRADGTLDVEGVAHHLYAEQDPRRPLTVAEWRDLAMDRIWEISKRGKTPILVGGTGLYFHAIIDNPQYPAVPPQEEWRASQSERPLEDLVAELREKDPAAAERVDLKNPRRVLRALEVATFGNPSEPAFGPSLVEAVQIGIERTREELYARVEANVDAMLRNGWMDEVRARMADGFSVDFPAWNAIGYRELREVAEGKRAIEDAVAAIKTASRHFAKRQLTWFRKDGRIVWLASSFEISNKALKIFLK
jgi:tRNA dimethylallyltransferase